jgi:hypothetical protein
MGSDPKPVNIGVFLQRWCGKKKSPPNIVPLMPIIRDEVRGCCG